VHAYGVFVLADLERMKTLRAVATGALGLSCLITLGAGLFALYERRRDPDCHHGRGHPTSAVGGAAAVEALSPWLARIGLGGAVQPVALGIVILALTYVSLTVGELTSKAIALRDPERVACLMAPVIGAISRMSAPLVHLLRVSTGLVLRVLGMRTPQESPFVSEEDVRYLVREGARNGIFEKTEEELVHDVFEFADTTVREVMMPRPNIQGIDIATPTD
jgi:putative hemolysin